MLRKTNGFLRKAAALAAVSLVVQACSSGSGGSQVGHGSQLAPTARAQVLNGGQTSTFRAGSEVLLTGKDSEDADGPVLGWSWRQTAGPAVRLIERDRTTVSFTAPEVSEAAKLSFALTVKDADDLTGDATVDVDVVPIADPDKFLSLDVRGATRNTFDRFEVVPALAEGASTGASPAPFTLSAKAYLVYPPRSNPNLACPIDASQFAAGVPSQTAAGCRVELLQDLTPDALPGGQTGIQGEWPANVPAVVRPAGLTADELDSEWWNPRYMLPIPRLDVADFNQQFVDSGERDRLLDTFNTPQAHIMLVFELSAPQNQQDATLVVNDVESAPISAPPVALAKDTRVVEKLVANDGAGLPTRAALPLEQVQGGITGRESALTAEVYYRTVDPDSTRYTLDSWLQMAGFASDGRGTLKPEAIAGTGEFAHAIYLNNYDLGFGRNMYTRTDPYGNVYAFVGNYLTLEGAIRAGAPFATVVMEYSPLRAPSDGTQKFVKFFTYVDDGSGDSRRVGSLNFDGRGELFTPGNCLACHGGAKPPGLSELVYDSGCGNTLDAACYSWPAKNRDGVDIADGNLQATFLPWDSGALLFADTDPAITQGPKRFDGLSVADRLRRDYGDYSRAAQEAQIKKLNEAAYATYCNASVVPDCPTDAARRLVEHWYGGLDQDGKLSAAAFDDSEAPIGWRNGETVSTPTSVDPGATAINPDSAEAIYHGVFAHHCRMCHTNITDPALRFDTYQKLKAEAANGDVTEAVFQRGVMPAARLTADRFWVSFAEGTPTAADLLAKEVGFESPDGQSGPAPKAQITGLGGTVARNASVRFSGADSLFAGAFAWTVEYEPPTLLAGDSDIAAFEPALVGAANSQLAFAAAKPGTYKVHLTIRDKDGAEFAADPVEVDVPDHLPEFGDLTLNIAEGGSETLSVLDELNKLCATAGCPEVFGDSPFSVAVNAAAWQASDGQLTLDDAARGTVTITATQPGPISAALPFTVTDADSETLTAAINVNIVPLSNPTATDDNDTTCAQTTIINDIVSGCAQPSVAVAGTRQVSIDVLANDVSDPAAGALHIDSFTQPAGGSSVGLVFQSGDSLVFRPALGFTGTATFGYVAVDSNTTGGRTSNEAEVSVTVVPTTRFSVEVQGALNGGGCLGCHVASTISTCSPGSEALAPNWQVYSNFKHCVGTPGGARSSSVLTWPLPSNTSHGGYLSVIGTWRESDDKNFRAVLRWIEEGAQDN